MLLLFPQGPWSAPRSGLGVEHTIVAGLDALFFRLAMGFLRPRFRSDPRWETCGTFTLGMLAIGIAVGGFGALSVSAPYAGLAERVSIGSFLLWTEVVALELYRHAEGGPETRARARTPPAAVPM